MCHRVQVWRTMHTVHGVLGSMVKGGWLLKVALTVQGVTHLALFCWRGEERMGQQLTGGGALIGIRGDGGLQVAQKGTSCFRWACMHAGSLTSVCTAQVGRYPLPHQQPFFCNMFGQFAYRYVRTYILRTFSKLLNATEHCGKSGRIPSLYRNKSASMHNTVTQVSKYYTLTHMHTLTHTCMHARTHTQHTEFDATCPHSLVALLHFPALQ